MNYFKSARVALVVGGMTLLSACTHSISDVDSKGKTANPVFPKESSAVRDEGSFVNLDNLKQMRPGLTKAQVYELIGVPHFKEGAIRVKEWDYIFHFTQQDKTVLTCQYKVLFDTDMTAQSFYLMPEDCLSRLKAPVAPQVHKELSGSSLFAFASAALSAEGVSQVTQLANELKSESLEGKHVVVTGHTDRIGNPMKNQQLSLARAESVKDMLVQSGIPVAIIETRGMGDAMPRINCPGKKSSAVIECLAPNRRMTLDVVDINSGK
ncbi:outer membrane protein assembly factor BamE [Salmonella enterica]|nr:outer membrane protein assembly factor BamE [Salmonella enterica]EFS3370496.1 outer membrane protein assembly factor BamE [Salmonella enterica]EGS4024358.1 outer membrane protein assembly factor BamE [Salmonella enterica]EHT4473677.1 outer membrane protein assembly factor BamE [Salmonella enterica]EKM9605742.1 outer membrane protein assembly factor BamE [Salmonella enterica]